MRIFVTGGTGAIGSAVVRELIARGDRVFALARSDGAADRLAGWGATPVAGDMTAPEPWTATLPDIDAFVHAGCDFSRQMEAIERRLLDALLPALATQPRDIRFVYTGGCWLFGATGETIATEETPFRPLPAFAWMIARLQRVTAAPGIHGIVIHPAMVYEPMGGVFSRFAREASEARAVRVVASEAVRWPLVHSEDLAVLYALALAHAPAGSSYIGAAIDGFPVGRIAHAFARRFDSPHQLPVIISADAIAAELGDWAKGYALDQRLSGAKARQDLG
jgi:nucleoside-diphosphate-sugar epimerase